MKLLLTSAGITNKTIEASLSGLLGKDFEQSHLVFVPTAAFVEPGDRGWVEEDIDTFRKLGFSGVDVLDISRVSPEIAKPRLGRADVLVFGGGNDFYIMDWINKLELKDFLKELLAEVVYVGISAGSCIAGCRLSIEAIVDLYKENPQYAKSDESLNFVPYLVFSHLGSDYFPKVNPQHLDTWSKKIPETIYVLDDNSALEVIDGQTRPVSEGKILTFNQG